MLCLFSSDHSLGDSILTVSKDIFKKEEVAQKDGTVFTRVTKEVETKDNAPISIFAIGKKYELPHVCVVDSEISSFWQAYKNAKELKLNLVYGIKLKVCSNARDTSPESELTESNVVILFKNSQAYYDFIPIYTRAATEFLCHGKRIDWKNLVKAWTPNLHMVIPFYSSFIARNSLILNSSCIPEFGSIEPEFLRQRQCLPFDNIIDVALAKYAPLTTTPFAKRIGVTIFGTPMPWLIKHLSVLLVSRTASRGLFKSLIWNISRPRILASKALLVRMESRYDWRAPFKVQ